MAFIQDLESLNFKLEKILEITLSYPLVLQMMGLRSREIHELQCQEATECHSHNKRVLMPSQSSFHHISLQRAKEMYTDLKCKPSMSSGKPAVELFTAGIYSDRYQ